MIKRGTKARRHVGKVAERRLLFLRTCFLRASVPFDALMPFLFPPFLFMP